MTDAAANSCIMVIAGEVSGDLHASGLLREFRAKHPSVTAFGVGGEQMAQSGFERLYTVEEVSFLGFVEVIKHLPFIRRMMRRLVAETIKRKPKVIVLVDYPGFNLRFAARIRKLAEIKHIPILYYISPQVWAWHASRVPQIAELVDRMAVIFDFEAPIYEKVGLQTDFVGHPLLEVTKPKLTADEFRESLGLRSQERLIGLLPGSRAQEVTRLLPIFVRSFMQLAKRVDNLKAVIGCSPALSEQYYRDLLQRSGLQHDGIRLVQGQTTDVQAHCDVALVASGTATLETAILVTPLVMAYKVAPLTYWIARNLVKIPHIALVNVVAGKRVVPEMIQYDARPDRIADQLQQFLPGHAAREIMIAELAEVKSRLGGLGASARVAEIVSEMMEP
ncbi:lipid-A-disaccharide synthase [bacterium]|nr:lipid-A-disaccharide synthase [bacterium]